MRLTFATDVSPAVIDLETAGHPLAPTWLEPVQADARLKDPDKIKADIIAKEATRLERLALDWNVGRIVALGIWTEPTGYEVLLCHDETEERAAIEACWALTQHRTIVGFNFKGFDGRYLIQRSRLLGIPARDLDLGKYSRKGSIVDLFQELTFNDGHYDQGAMRRTLKAFAKRFGLPVNDDIDGKDIPALVAADDWAGIAAHLRSDLELTVALARRLGVLSSGPDGWIHSDGVGHHTVEANARLIAAAPDLLETLRGIIEIGKRDMSNPKYDGYFKSARVAIAKAVQP